MLQNILTEDCFPPSGFGVHPVQANTSANGGKGVSGKVEVGDGVEDEVAAGADEIGQRTADGGAQLLYLYTGHKLEDQFFLILDFCEQLIQLLAVLVGGVAAFPNELTEEVMLYLRRQLKYFRSQVLQIFDFHTVFRKDLGEEVVLFPGGFQIGNVVEQQSLQFFRYQMFKLNARFMQHDGFQFSNLTGHMDRHVSLLYCFDIDNDTAFFAKMSARFLWKNGILPPLFYKRWQENTPKKQRIFQNSTGI